MNQNDYALHLEGFDKNELIDLEEQVARLENEELEFHSDLNESALGEPATILAIYAAGSIVLPAVIAYLIKKRKGFKFYSKEVITNKDGSKTVRIIKTRSYESESPSADVIKAATDLTIDQKKLADALKTFES